MYEKYGVRMLCFASWTNPNGKAQTSVYVFYLCLSRFYNDLDRHETTSVSPKFSQQFPRWKTMKGLPSAFMDYAELFQDSTGEESSDEDEETKAANKSKYPWAVLGKVPEELPDGVEEYPLLPDIPKGTGQEWIGGGKIVIRQFVTAVYCGSIGVFKNIQTDMGHDSA
jgi:hypothetical protein